MIWEVRTKASGDWIEVQISVARDGEKFAWLGRLMMRSDEWRDFVSRLGLQEGAAGTWRSR